MAVKMPGVLGVPVMAPLLALIDRPLGSPVAVQVSDAPLWVSVATGDTWVMADPVTLDFEAIVFRVTVLNTVQLKLVEPENDAPSVAVMATL